MVLILYCTNNNEQGTYDGLKRKLKGFDEYFNCLCVTANNLWQ